MHSGNFALYYPERLVGLIYPRSASSYIFEARRGLFWEEPRNFEQRTDDEGDTSDGPPSPNLNATPTGGRLATTYDVVCSRPHTLRMFGGAGFRTWNNPALKPRPYH
ncbi:hypothetical protein AVEN_97396-1 [Araneus ventricosus]|uniref:Uncharacterized protein n=1 Tax=Araneus ventricosus TaxID=182803 RepID=A0A4Y2VWJ4_ARAVE|nr:hypothetical protein AVEN_97396-1 [Araneus ventricosus]